MKTMFATLTLILAAAGLIIGCGSPDYICDGDGTCDDFAVCVADDLSDSYLKADGKKIYCDDLYCAKESVELSDWCASK